MVLDDAGAVLGQVAGEDVDHAALPGPLSDQGDGPQHERPGQQNRDGGRHGAGHHR